MVLTGKKPVGQRIACCCNSAKKRKRRKKVQFGIKNEESRNHGGRGENRTANSLGPDSRGALGCGALIIRPGQLFFSEMVNPIFLYKQPLNFLK